MKKLLHAGLLTLLLAATPVWRCSAAGPQFTNLVAASLTFREAPNPLPDCPNLILVYLCLDNRWDTDVSWTCDAVADVQVEVLDSMGKPIPQRHGGASILHNDHGYWLPYGSRLEWLISHGGISHGPMKTDAQANCALSVGGGGWEIPRASLPTCSLRLRVQGRPWSSGPKTILFEVPATPIVVQSVLPTSLPPPILPKTAQGAAQETPTQTRTAAKP